MTGAAPIHDITNTDGRYENCQKLSAAAAKMNIAETNCQLCSAAERSAVYLASSDGWMLRLRVQMNGGLWRRVEASITLGNNAMTNQRDSGMTIALERIQYWEIELIDGETRGGHELC